MKPATGHEYGITRRAFCLGVAAAGAAFQTPAWSPRTTPLIEAHSHILTEQGVELAKQERLAYLLVMARPKEIAFIQKHKDLMGACVWLNAGQKGHLQEARDSLREYPEIMKGFKLHPAGDGYTVTCDLLEGLFELANERDLMIQSHTEAGACNAAKFAPLLEKFPKTKLVLVHGFPAEEAFKVVNAFENVYIDNSYTAWGQAYQQAALKAVGKKKLLFGIDSPEGFPSQGGRLLPHFRDAASEVAAFYGNDRDVVEHVFYKNALRLLGWRQLPARG
jgi:predicted TIM-barrel fold metal-dependent hydrolase